MTRYYAGIGSRQTPAGILLTMERVAGRLAQQGWSLRSGGAPGADSAFARGHLALTGDLHHDRFQCYRPERTLPDWSFEVAAQHHPAWGQLGLHARRLHARNGLIVLGPYGPDEPALASRFVLCWTPDGAGGGGTGQAIRVARAYGIPVFDLALEPVRRRLSTFLTSEVTA